MKNENIQIIPDEADDCLVRGICTVNSTLTSVQEIIVLYVKELTFYILQLKEFGIFNETIKYDIIESFFNILTNVEYRQEQFQEIISKFYNYIIQSKALYEKYCIENNLEIKKTKSYFKYSQNFDLTEAIRKGEKYFLKKIQNLSQTQKNFYDIILFLCKSITVKLVELNRLGEECNDAYYAMLSLLNYSRTGEFLEAEIEKEIAKTMDIYYALVTTIYFKQIKLYGNIKINKVSFSSYTGKAILVSGSDFKKLEQVLEATKNTEIGVYTHGLEMLIAHSFSKINSYPNLKGHFGSGFESSLVDFATFPGPILMTKGNLYKIEYLYRGRLFTKDFIAPHGVIKINDDDYTPLIKEALISKGFSKSTTKPSINVGFSKAQIGKIVNDVMKKVKEGKIKHIYIVGLLSSFNPMPIYFEEFFKILPKNSFTFSLAYKKKADNVFSLESFFDYTVLYLILKQINKHIPLKDLDISIFVTRGDKHTISNALYLKHIGIKNVYLCKCLPTLISPSIIQTLKDSFNIKEMTTPQENL